MHFIMNCMEQSEEREMAGKKELVLYYTPQKSEADRLIKSVMIRLGIRIRNIGPEQTGEKVGVLAGLTESQEGERVLEELPVIPEKMLVFCGFGRQKLEELLFQLRRAGAPAVPMKAMMTEHNQGWSLYALYRELLEEHEKIGGNAE